jgi:hypothetical protein
LQLSAFKEPTTVSKNDRCFIPDLGRKVGLIDFLQVLPEPGRIDKKDINKKKCAQWKKKNDQVQQENADANQNPVSDTHGRLPKVSELTWKPV